MKFEEDDCYCYCNDDIEEEEEDDGGDDNRMIAVATARVVAWDRRNSNRNREHGTSPRKAFAMGGIAVLTVLAFGLFLGTTSR